LLKHPCNNVRRFGNQIDFWSKQLTKRRSEIFSTFFFFQALNRTYANTYEKNNNTYFVAVVVLLILKPLWLVVGDTNGCDYYLNKKHLITRVNILHVKLGDFGKF